ncbi:hypothetical protein EYR38_009105 [Pleurotus pulmonarius]|nr:hypothetical protein EYR38_009105 [Pleurotus pulmonarius]
MHSSPPQQPAAPRSAASRTQLQHRRTPSLTDPLPQNTTLPSIRQLQLPPPGIAQPHPGQSAEHLASYTYPAPPHFVPHHPSSSSTTTTSASTAPQAPPPPPPQQHLGRDRDVDVYTMAESDIEDTEQPPKKKRRRQALSCTECKRRKIKCDRFGIPFYSGILDILTNVSFFSPPTSTFINYTPTDKSSGSRIVPDIVPLGKSHTSGFSRLFGRSINSEPNHVVLVREEENRPSVTGTLSSRCVVHHHHGVLPPPPPGPGPGESNSPNSSTYAVAPSGFPPHAMYSQMQPPPPHAYHQHLGPQAQPHAPPYDQGRPQSNSSPVHTQRYDIHPQQHQPFPPIHSSPQIRSPRLGGPSLMGPPSPPREQRSPQFQPTMITKKSPLSLAAITDVPTVGIPHDPLGQPAGA